MSAFQHKSHLQKKPYAVFDFQMAYAKTILISLYHFWNYGGQSFEMDFQSSFLHKLYLDLDRLAVFGETVAFEVGDGPT